ncbi:MAG: hypothetical protein IPG44_11800, partial [Anaerolineales bacterium]|nr:hypothetical protein [Anaerolineales bacterium]
STPGDGLPATQSLKELDKSQTSVIVFPQFARCDDEIPAECRELGIPYLYDPSQQVLRLEGKGTRPRYGRRTLFCNDYEFGLISKKTGWSLDQILITSRCWSLPAAATARTCTPRHLGSHSDRAGGRDRRPGPAWGDAFRGVISSPGTRTDLNGNRAARSALLSAVYRLEQRGTQNHSYAREDFVQRFRKHFDDSQPDVLLK